MEEKQKDEVYNIEDQDDYGDFLEFINKDKKEKENENDN